MATDETPAPVDAAPPAPPDASAETTTDPDMPAPPLAPGHDKVEDGIASLDFFSDDFIAAYPEYKDLAKTEFRVPKAAVDAAMADPTTRNMVLGFRHAYDKQSRALVEKIKAADAHVKAANERTEQFKAQVQRMRGVIDRATAGAKAPDLGGKAPDPFTEAGQRTIAQTEAAAFLAKFAGGIAGGMEEFEKEAQVAAEKQQRAERIEQITAFAKAHDDFEALRGDIVTFRKAHPGVPVEAAYHHVRAIRQTEGKKQAGPAKAAQPRDEEDIEIPKGVAGDVAKTIAWLEANPAIAKKLNQRVHDRA